MTPELIKQMELIQQPSLIVAKFSGDGLKRISFNRFEGHAIRWHDPNRKPDNEGNRLDLAGEWFSPKTNLMQKMGYPIVGKPVNYQHGMHKDFGATGIGLLDFTEEDEIGQFVKGELYTREQYIEMLRDLGRIKGYQVSDEQYGNRADMALKAVQTLVNEVPLQFSGGFDPSTWMVDPVTKHIDQSGLIHAAFTPTPADDLNPIISFKSMFFEAFNLEHERKTFDMSIPASSDTSIDAQHKETNPENAVSTKYTSNTPNKGTNKMGIQEWLASLIASAQELLAGMGASEDEATAMAADVVDELKADAEKLPEEEQAKAVDEELVKSWTGKMISLAIAKFEKKAADKARFGAASKNETQKALETWKRNQPADMGNALGGYTGGSRITSIQEFTPYSHWKAEDYSFAIGLADMSKRTQKALDFQPDQRFYREFADKAEKRLREGSIKMDMKAMKGIHAIKSDELDYSTQAGFGDEWVPTVWADNIWERPRLENVVQNLFGSVEMPSNPYEYPVESADPTVYLVAETKNENVLALDISTSPIPDSKVATAKVTFTAAKLGLRVMYSSELGEDGIARLVPQFRSQSERAMMDAIDYVAINGDTATTLNINSDGETITDTTRRYLAYNGLLKQAIVTATTNKLDASAASPSLTLLRSTRALLGNAEGYNPENLAWIMDYPTYIKLLNDDVIITIDKYGAAATVVTGELGRIDGIRVFVSAQMALADSDGKITQTSNVVNRGRAILVHVPTWLFGYRRRITQSLDFIPWADAWSLVITMRNHFVPRTAANGTLQSTDDSTAVLYNLGV